MEPELRLNCLSDTVQGLSWSARFRESQEISERYLEQILNTLRTSGLLISTRGAKGGYELAKAPSEITLGDIVRSLEGPLDVVSCTGNSECERAGKCATFYVWKEVKETLENLGYIVKSKIVNTMLH